jgi:hypothetical protein
MEERKGRFVNSDGEILNVTIIDNGEEFNPEESGSIPNHEKIEIIYQSEKTI